MSFNSREIAADPGTVFAALVDPSTYPSWLIGTAEIRSVDDDWPAPGSQFHHRVGAAPLTIRDSTSVIDIDDGRMLRLDVRARPLIRATVTFRVVGDGDTTMVSVEEEPRNRLIGNLVRPALDPMTHVRNHRSLRRLGKLIERNRTEPDQGAG